VARTEGKRKKLKAERNLVMRESNNDRRFYAVYAVKRDALAREGKSMGRRLREAYFRRRERALEAIKKVAEIDRILAEINLEQRK
jgi:D-alanyl-D-alanine carboxypeptidase